ncbi:MAG: hypothetical protein JNJ54_04520 [Myxococcaceae bacterium]|nr:hypothetical protein [Myxococcaceae bacterium]
MGGPRSDYVTGVGDAGSYFTKHLPTNKAVQSVMPGGAPMDPVGLGNLVVGVLNLGVGIYNAVQLKRVNRDVNELRQELAFGLGTVETMLGQQARTLEILLKANREIADALRLLRAEIHEGFTNVNARFDQQEADSFHRLTLELLTVWRRVGEEMIVETIAPDELSRLVAAADKLDSWARVSAAKIQAGHPARQPFLIARALSLRAVADAKLLQSEKLGRVAEARLHDFVPEVAAEARALCSGQTTYHLAFEVPEILAQYAYLRRGLRVAGDLKTDTLEGESRPLPWSDYLEHVGTVLAASPASQEKEKALSSRDDFPLKTIRDYEWFLDLIGEPKTSEFNVHSKDAVTIKELFDVVGAPVGLKVAESAVVHLKQIALPTFRTSLAAAISTEFGWSEPPLLAATVPAPKRESKKEPPPEPTGIRRVAAVFEPTACPRCARQYPKWKKYCEHCQVAL